MTSDDWASVADVCERVAARLPELAGASVSGIRRDLEAYLVVPEDEHLAAVAEQQRRRLEALAQRRLLDATDVARAAELARRRARQGIPVDVLIGAYHVGDQELWRALCVDPRGATPLLPDVATLMLTSLHAISMVLAAAHGEVTRELQGHRVTLSHRLVELLLTEGAGPEASRVADALELDPDGDFNALLWRRTGGEIVLPPEVQRELDRAPVPAVHSYHSGVVVVLGQDPPEDWLHLLAGRLAPAGLVGVGLRRPGLDGAATSLGDARLALAAADVDRPVVWFAEAWAEACLLAEQARLEPLLADAVRVGEAHPHLAETVLAFAASDMSVARTGETLHLHANSVTYRLQRWAQLVGWDPRSFDGLIRSVAACRLALRGSSR